MNEFLCRQKNNDDNKNTFSGIDFVNEYRNRVDSLQTLLSELEDFQSFLKEETITIIHKEYNSFIEFSSQLNNISSNNLDPSTTILPSCLNQLKSFEHVIFNMLEKIKNQLLIKKIANEKKMIGKKLLEIYQQLQNDVKIMIQQAFENVFNEKKDQKQIDDNNQKEGTMNNDEHASEMKDFKLFNLLDNNNELQGLLNLGEEDNQAMNGKEEEQDKKIYWFLYVADILKRTSNSLKEIEKNLLELSELSSQLINNNKLSGTIIDNKINNTKNINDKQHLITLFEMYERVEELLREVEKDFIKKVNEIFIYSIKNNLKFYLIDCLEAFSYLNKMELLENQLFLNIVTPTVNEIFKKENLFKCKNNFEEFTNLIYNKLIEELYIKLLPLLNIILTENLQNNNLQNTIIKYNFITNGVLQPIINNLTNDNCKFLYEYRNVKQFHLMFKEQKKFLENLQIKFVPKHETLKFQEYIQLNLMKKWQLKIYFLLVKQNIVKEFENVLLQQKQEYSLENNIQGTLAGKWGIVKDRFNDLLMNQIFNVKYVYLNELNYEFILLYIQLVGRFQKWIIEDYLPFMVNSTKQLNNNENMITELCLLISKLQQLIDILNVYFEENKNDIPFKDELIEIVKTRLLFDNQLKSSQLLSLIEENIINALSERCIETLISKVSNAYSLTTQSKLNNNQASYFISEVFKPLIQFKNFNEKELNSICLKKIICQVIFNTCEQFKLKCIKIVETTRKTQQSLERLKKKKGSNSNSTINGIQDQIVKDTNTLEEILLENFKIIIVDNNMLLDKNINSGVVACMKPLEELKLGIQQFKDEEE
ncbi:hypothetical protein ABK040_004064 [Willaertia magna]